MRTVSKSKAALRPPCTYQGGKQRIAPQIIDIMADRDGLLNGGVRFCDLCCGSGAVTLELVNRKFLPDNILMCDAGPWGMFWRMIGQGTFDLDIFSQELSALPVDKSKIKAFMETLAGSDASYRTAYRFLMLQAASFGGKQIWVEGSVWRHSSFRDYWQPMPASVRQSPVNPFQPEPDELYARVERIVNTCRGLVCRHDSIVNVTAGISGGDVIVYMDPPYPGTTGYAYDFDITKQVTVLLANRVRAVYVSLDRPLSDDAVELGLAGPKGGVSGNRRGRCPEWLSRFVV